MSTSSSQSDHHLLPFSVYFGVAVALLVLTGVTVYVASLEFGAYNLVVAMLIAALKAGLVALFFMHLKYDNKIYMVVFLSALAFLAVFVILTMFDTLGRGAIDPQRAKPIREQAAMYDSLKATSHGETEHGEGDTTAAADSAAHDTTVGDTTVQDTSLQDTAAPSADTAAADPTH